MTCSTSGGCDMDMAGQMMPAYGFGAILLIAILLIVAIALAVRIVRASQSGGPASVSARSELDTRYARGEIDRETYIAIRGDLLS